MDVPPISGPAAHELVEVPERGGATLHVAISARFLEDLHALGDGERLAMAREYVAIVSGDPASLLELLIFLATADRERALAESDAGASRPFWRAMIELLSGESTRLESFVLRMDSEPKAEAKRLALAPLKRSFCAA